MRCERIKQKEIITITAETIGNPRAYAIGYGELIELVPFPFGHGFYSFLTIKLVAEDQSLQISEYNVHNNDSRVTFGIS